MNDMSKKFIRSGRSLESRGFSQHHFSSQRSGAGFALLYTVVLFFAISLLMVFTAIAVDFKDITLANEARSSRESYFAAESITEDVLYRLNNAMNTNNIETHVLGNSTINVTIANSGLQQRTITVSGDEDNSIQTVALTVSQSSGASFNYGLQAGKGGFEMAGGARVNGNVYSNGDIIGSGGPIITGSATVANQSNPVADQTSTGATPPSESISFGGNTTPQDAGQSFQVSTTTPVTSVRLYMKKSTNNWMNNITVRITNDSSGKPGKTTIASATLGASQVTTSFNYLSIPFTSTPSLTPGNTYWVVLDTNTTWGSYYTLGASSNGYAQGIGKTGSWSSSNGGTWTDTSPSGLDAYFDVYVGGDTGLINGITIGTSGGDAWSHEVNNSTVSGTIYCQASTNNNKACDTSRADPVEQPFPISDGNILDWKAEAEAGGTYVGNLSYGGADTPIHGPLKIDGNLTVGSGAVLTVTGRLWVTGNINLNGGAIVKLPAGQTESEVIVADGRISSSGGGQFQGSGEPNSYILVITTSTCPVGSCGGNNPAIDVTGGTGSVVLNAQKGTIEFSGGAHANQATAYKIEMDGGTVVDYEGGLVDMSFSSGPSGAWAVENWEEI